MCSTRAFVGGVPQRTCPSPGSTRSLWSPSHVQARGRGRPARTRVRRLYGERAALFGARRPLDTRRPSEPIFGRVGVSRETPAGRAGPAVTLTLAGLGGNRSVAYRAASPAPGQHAQKRNRGVSRIRDEERGVRTLTVSVGRLRRQEVRPTAVGSASLSFVFPRPDVEELSPSNGLAPPNRNFQADPSSELACYFPGGAAAGAPRGDGRRDDRLAR